MTEEPLQLASEAGAKKSNLAFALWTLPPDRRKDALVFYDFCRVVDDIADEDIRTAEEKRELLGRWKTALKTGKGLPEPLAHIIKRHNLDRDLMREIILGVEMDIEPRRYEKFDDLKAYCWRVACAVGLVSLDLFGARGKKAREYAEHLGYALQITNILRDVAEDAAIGRIYLPIGDLYRFGVSEEKILEGSPDGNFTGLMRYEAQRAYDLFTQAREALSSPIDQALVPAETMRAIYEKILSRMARDNFRVFHKRYRVATWQKVLIMGRVVKNASSQGAPLSLLDRN